MIYDIASAPVEQLLNDAGILVRKPGHRKKFDNERDIINMVGAFDIESTTLCLPEIQDGKRNDHSFMYIWQWQLGPTCTVVGRTWAEYTVFCNRIHDALVEIQAEKGLHECPLLVSYIHNLAYEFQFLSGIYQFKQEQIFFRDLRKPLYCRMYDCLEYRCSYAQSNMSLAAFAQKMGCKSYKRSGRQFDYSVIRYPWTELTDKEIEYCVNDVICLQQAIRLEMQKDGDDLYSIPLTSTGYVRRDCKRALHQERNWIISMLPASKQYRMLRAAFRGGNTHANRAYVGKILDNVYSLDMTSCYPAQQLTQQFPMGGWAEISYPCTLERCIRFISVGRCVLARYRFRGLELKDHKTPIPYLSLAKTRSAGFQLDNGRILYADVCQVVLTEIDLKIVLDQYRYDSLDVINGFVCRKGYLPGNYRRQIMEYYNQKTDLKGQHSTDGSIEYYYGKSKNKLNSIYGMSAQAPIHPGVVWTESGYGDPPYKWPDPDQERADLLKAAFPYSWGVYTTAYARAALQEGIDEAERQHPGCVVYCDTDSIKTIGYVDLSAINERRQAEAIKMDAWAKDRAGVPHYVGVFQQDGQYDKFITQGAKRYATVTDGKMHITVSGVTHQKNEQTGEEFCVEQLGSLENFKHGMKWVKSGGTIAEYNDLDDFDWIDPNTGKTVHIGKNVAIVESDYTLQIQPDYARLLSDIELYGEWIKKHE